MKTMKLNAQAVSIWLLFLIRVQFVLIRGQVDPRL